MRDLSGVLGENFLVMNIRKKNLFSISLLAGALLSASALAMSKKSHAPEENHDAVHTPHAETADSVWVGKSDKAKSCAKERGIDIDSMGKELQTKGIKILARKKIPDGKVRIQMCGVDKGDMNGYLVAKKDVEKAKELGYQQLPSSY